MKTDTIAAIATGMSNSGIGIVRISGEEAFSVIDSIFRNRKGERVSLSLAQSHTVHYGYIYDGDEKVDEALVIIMKGPHSYTAEDTVEIDCHGGVLMVRRIDVYKRQTIHFNEGKLKVYPQVVKSHSQVLQKRSVINSPSTWIPLPIVD